MLLALALRIYELGASSARVEESVVSGLAGLPWDRLLAWPRGVEGCMPGFFVLAKLWRLVFGDGVWAMRMMPALAGTLAVVPVWFIAARLEREWGGAPPARRGVAPALAAGMVALSAMACATAREGRGQAVLLLVAGCAVLAVLRLAGTLRASPSTRSAMLLDVVVAGSLVGLLPWLHASALLTSVLLVGLLAFLLAGHGGGWRHRAWGWGGMAAIVVLLAAMPAFWALAGARSEWQLAVGAPFPPLATLLPASDLRSSFPEGGPALMGLAAVLALLLFGGVQAVRHRASTWLGLAVTMGLLLAGMEVLRGWRPMLADDAAVLLLPLMMALVANAAARLPAMSFALAVLLLISLQTHALIRPDAPDLHQQWRQAAEIVDTVVRFDEPVLVPDSVFPALSLTRQLAERRAMERRMVVIPAPLPLERELARLLVRGIPSGEQLEDVGQICTRLNHAVQLWILSRSGVVHRPGERVVSVLPALEQALLARGGAPQESYAVTGVALTRWRAPVCP